MLILSDLIEVWSPRSDERYMGVYNYLYRGNKWYKNSTYVSLSPEDYVDFGLYYAISDNSRGYGFYGIFESFRNDKSSFGFQIDISYFDEINVSSGILYEYSIWKFTNYLNGLYSPKTKEYFLGYGLEFWLLSNLSIGFEFIKQNDETTYSPQVYFSYKFIDLNFSYRISDESFYAIYLGLTFPYRF